MENRNSFRGYGITTEFANKFKSSKFYTDIYLMHKDEIIVGVRDGYICLYYNCDCIAKIESSSTLLAKIDPYYTDGRFSYLTDKEMVELYPIIKKRSDERKKNEKQAQQRLFIQNNKSISSEWYCVDVEYTKSLCGKSTAEDWRFDLIAISKSKPYKIALIELKYGAGAMGEPSGIRTHIKDFYAFHTLKPNSGFDFSELKREIVSIINKLRLLGVSVPEELEDVHVRNVADNPEYYFITLNNNPSVIGGSRPKQTMSGYLFSDKRWNCQRISKLVKEEGDYFKLIKGDKTFVPKFLFSEKCLPDFSITDIINDASYDKEIADAAYSYSQNQDLNMSTPKAVQPKSRLSLGNDTPFKRICRNHQAWFREHVLNLAMGENTRTHIATNETEEAFHIRRKTVEDINHLTDEDASRLMNFVPSFHEEIRRAMIEKYGRVSESHDLMNDMLRSENIPWNIFVPMFQNEAAAINILKKITNRNDIAKITDWKIEYNPKTLYDNTSFDAFVQYQTVSGKPGIVGIEVKYTEEGYKVHDRELERISNPGSSYSKVTRMSDCFIDTDTEQFNTKEYIQIWRNHMLAISMGMKYGSIYDSVTVYPSGNTHFHSSNGHTGALESYKSLLSDKGKESFHFISFEELFSLLQSTYSGERYQNWIEYLQTRYIVEDKEYEHSQYADIIKTNNSLSDIAEHTNETTAKKADNIRPSLNVGNQEWVLNLVDYPIHDMLGSSMAKARFTSDAPVASMEVTNVDKYYSLDQFKKAYNQERGSQFDQKNAAYWYFCRSVKAGDIIYLAKGPVLYGYAVVKGEKVMTDKVKKEHSWKVEWFMYDRIIKIAPNIATPFFVNLKKKVDKKILLHKAFDEQL